MRTVHSTRKCVLYLTVASCAVLFTFMYVVHNHELPDRSMFRDLNKEESYLKIWQKSAPINDMSETLNNLETLSSIKKVLIQKRAYPENIDRNFNDNQLSISQQDRPPERLPSLNGNYLFQNLSKGVVSPGNNKSKLFHKYDVSWTSHKEEYKIKDDKDFRVETNVLLLAEILDKKLSHVSVGLKVNNFRPTCESEFKLANSCDNNKCLQTELPTNVTARVEQLVTPRKLQMSPEEHEILRQMANEVTRNVDIVLLTAVSSNHFLPSQALIQNLHENVYPHLKNFTLVFYNLGLTEHERTMLVRYCKCQVIDFPFHKFPEFMKTLKCYSWKPIMIKAHLQKTNLVFWMDASVRFHNSSTDLHQLIQTARERGVQVGGPREQSAFRTYRSMYHFFGDEPCAYLNLGQVKATFGIYHREYFVDRVILEPWVACALNEDCMCPGLDTNRDSGPSQRMAERYYEGKGPIIYGLCHRFDQSAISLILHKLYQDFFVWVAFEETPVLAIRRRHFFAYFESLMKSEKDRIQKIKNKYI